MLRARTALLAVFQVVRTASTGALFLPAGALYERPGTMDLAKPRRGRAERGAGGSWSPAPSRASSATLTACTDGGAPEATADAIVARLPKEPQ